jgi:peroxiredoxin
MVNKRSLADLLFENLERMGKANPPIANAYQSIVDRLHAGNAGSSGPKKGDLLAPFQMPDDQGRLVRSTDLLAKGPLVISMNRGQWCSFCRIELNELQENLPEIEGLGASIVAISPEIRPYADKLRERCGLTFPVLCDVDNSYALTLGLAIWLGDEVKRMYAVSGANLPMFQGNSGWMVPIPATYVVGQDGRIVESFVDPDFRKRMEPEVIIAALRAL